MITIKTILAAASGGTASEGAIELACRFARRFEAHVEGYHVKPDPFAIMRYDSGVAAGFGDVFVDKFNAEANAVAAKVHAAFVAGLQRHRMNLAPRPANALPGVIGASAVWREELGYGPVLVAQRARFFDLAVLGRSERVVKHLHSDTVEETLLLSGRPLLLAPAKAPESVGDRIAIGWNGSAEAVRAMTAALSFLSTARDTMIVSIGETSEESVASAIDYLAWHDIKARHVHADSRGALNIGHRLLEIAETEGADLLAMGGYGHMPWREVVFGGATREVIGSSPLPVLLTH